MRRAQDEERRALTRGRDIHAATAPRVVEAATRAFAGQGKRTGVASAGEIFDACDFPGSLKREDIAVELD